MRAGQFPWITPGVGKTHIAVALAVAACRAGYAVYFTALDHMVRQLKAADAIGRLASKLRTYLRPRVLVLDEVGYLPLDREEANLVFQMISKRYEKGAMVLTCNKAFSEWGMRVFGDGVLATANLDRLLHHCEVIAINGTSYRLKPARRRRDHRGQRDRLYPPGRSPRPAPAPSPRLPPPAAERQQGRQRARPLSTTRGGPMPAPLVHLDLADAAELAEMLTFISQCSAAPTTPSSPPHSAASSAPRATTSPSCAPTWPASPSCSATTTASNSSAPAKLTIHPARQPIPRLHGREYADSYYRTSTTTSSGKKIYYYQCLGSDDYRYQGGRVCGNKPVRADYVDTVVWDHVTALLADPALIRAEIDKRLERARTSDPVTKKRGQLEQALAKTAASIAAMITAFSEQLLTIDELRARMPDLRARETGLKDQIAALDAQAADRDAYLKLADDLEGFLAQLRGNSATATTEDRQRVLRAARPGHPHRTRENHHPPPHPRPGTIQRRRPPRHHRHGG